MAVPDGSIMSDLLHLFDTDDFMTRDQCGVWSPFNLWMAQLSDTMIALAYFVIPATLLYFWANRRTDNRHIWIVLWFAAFIGLCGLTHVCQVLSFHWPAYRLFTLVNFVTGLVSMVSAVLLPAVVIQVMSGPSMTTMMERMTQSDFRRAELEKEVMTLRADFMTVRELYEAEKDRHVGLLEAIGEMRAGANRSVNDKLRKAENLIDSVHPAMPADASGGAPDRTGPEGRPEDG